MGSEGPKCLERQAPNSWRDQAIDLACPRIWAHGLFYAGCWQSLEGLFPFAPMLKRSLVSLALLVLNSSFFALQAASPHAGFYVGMIHTSVSGSVTVSERPIGAVSFTVSFDGRISSSGDMNGTVTDAGDIAWNPNSTGFATGKIQNGVLTTSTSIDHQNGTISHFRIEAKNGGPGIGEANALAGRIEQLNPMGGARNLNRVRFADGHFFTVGRGGAFARSYDGKNWTRSGIPTVLNMVDVTFGNGRYVAVGDSGARFWSTNGLDWVASPGGTGPFTSVAFGNGKFVCVNFLGTASESTDGAAWAPASASSSGAEFLNGQFVNWGKSAFGNGIYLVASQQGLDWSADGTAWTRATNAYGAAFGNTAAVAFGNGLFIANDAADNLWTSRNAIDWKFVDKIEFRSIAYGLGLFVGVGDQSYISADGELWVNLKNDSFLPDFHESGYIDPLSETPVVGSFLDGSSGTFTFGHNGYLAWYKHQFANGSGTAPQLTTETLRAAMNLRYSEVPIVVGNRGTMIHVEDRQTVTFRLLPPVTTADLVHGARDQTTLVFVGTGGTIVRNTDQTKTNWAVANSGTTANLKHVAFFPDHRTGLDSLFIATGEGGTILTSPNGSSWSRRNSGVSVDLAGSAVRERPRAFLVAGVDGSLLESTNGVDWTRIMPLPAPRPVRIFQNANIDKSFVIEGRGDNGLKIDSMPLGTTDPAVRFTMGSPLNLPEARFTDAALGNGRHVVVGDRYSAVSLNGADWVGKTNEETIASVAFGKGKFVGAGGTELSVSSDGLRWQRTTNISPTKSFRAVTYGGGRFVAVGTAGLVMISDDGLAWQNRSIPNSTVNYNEVAFANGTFLAVGTSGSALSSTDLGETWIQKGTSLPEIQGVAWGNGRWVAAASEGWTAISTNAQNWERKQHPYISPVENRPSYSEVSFADGVFYAASKLGEISISTNGLDWKRSFTGIGLELQGGLVGNGSILYVADNEIHRLSVPDSHSPSIAQHPASTELPEGGTLVLSASATGTGLEYAWLKDGAALANGGRISGANSATLTIAGVTPEDAGRYTFTVSNVSGSRSSHDAEVRVALKPAITRQPASATVVVGSAAILSVGLGGGEGTIRWFKNGAPIPSASSAELSFPAVTVEDAAAYHAEVANAAGTVRTIPAVLSVVSDPPGLALDANWPAVPIPFAALSSTFLESVAVQPDGKILVGGYFKVPHPSGGFFENVMRLNADGTLDSSFAPLVADGAPARFHTLASGQILFMGWFDKLGGVSTKGLARVNANGTLDASYQAGIGPAYQGPHWAQPRADGKLLVSGGFSVMAGVSNRFVGLLNTDGTPDPSFIPSKSINNEVSTFDFQSNGSIVIAGKFAAPKSRVARLLADGSEDAAFNASGTGLGAGVAPYNFPQIYRALVAADDKIFIGGFFGTYNGVSMPALARLNADGTLDASFNPQVVHPAIGQATVSDIEYYGANLLVAGSFRGLGGRANSTNLALIDPSGVAASGLNLTTPPDGVVRFIVPSGTGFVLGGNFNKIDGKSSPRLARLKGGSATGLPLAIRAQPQSISAKAGEPVLFAVAATGDNTLSFQWKKDGQVLAGQTRAVLAIETVSAAHAGSYTVEVKDGSGTLTSTAATLAVGQESGGFAGWAADFDLPANASGLTDDADGDGCSNAAEYAFGTNPALASSKPALINRPVMIGNQYYPAVSYIRNKNATGVAIQVRASTTVTFGTAAEVIATSAPEDLGNGFERVTVRATALLITTFFFEVRSAAN